MSLVSIFLAIRAFFKLFLISLLVFVSLIVGSLLYFFPIASKKFNRLVSYALMWIFNINVNFVGNHVKESSPCLFVSNHISFLDFIVLNYFTVVSFVAKEEVSKMPILGILARLNRCIFTSRTKRSSLSDSLAITKSLASGINVAMFPESTTTSGNVIPFHSSMFVAASNAAKELNSDVFVQPISLIYTKMNGLPLNTRGMIGFTWCADRSIFSIMMNILYNPGSIELYLVCHKPVVFTANTDRKEATEICENAIKIAISNYRKYGTVALG